MLLSAFTELAQDWDEHRSRSDLRAIPGKLIREAVSEEPLAILQAVRQLEKAWRTYWVERTSCAKVQLCERTWLLYLEGTKPSVNYLKSQQSAPLKSKGVYWVTWLVNSKRCYIREWRYRSTKGIINNIYPLSLSLSLSLLPVRLPSICSSIFLSLCINLTFWIFFFFASSVGKHGH